MSALDQLTGLVPRCEMAHRADFGYGPVEWHECERPAAWFACAEGEDPGSVFCTECVLDQALLACDTEIRPLSQTDLAEYACGLFDGIWAMLSQHDALALMYADPDAPGPPERTSLYRYGWYEGAAVQCLPTWEAYEKEES